MYIRGLVLFNLIVLTKAPPGILENLSGIMHSAYESATAAFPSNSSVTEADLKKWNSYRMCPEDGKPSSYDDNKILQFCQAVDVSAASALCWKVNVDYGTASEPQPHEMVLCKDGYQNWLNYCIALGQTDSVAIVFSFNRYESKCSRGRRQVMAYVYQRPNLPDDSD